MEPSKELSIKIASVRVCHDLQRQILEMTSFLRVMNNFYKRKIELQNRIKPLILRKFKEETKKNNNNEYWLHPLPIALNILSKDFLKKEDSFKFPDSIILFESWMHLGIKALYPRIALQFQFPGLFKGEKVRNRFQFIYSTSRGFGFPIYFGPEFYSYKFKLARILDPLLKWSYTVCHRANQAIMLVNKLLKSKRHHPGEYEAVIVSEFTNNIFKGIDTILHGYFKNEAKDLGKFSSLNDVLSNSTFYYSIGDHALRIERDNSNKVLSVPLITHEFIVKNYSVDFKFYVKTLLDVNKKLVKKITHYRELRNNLISKLKKKDKVKLWTEQSKHFAKKIARMSRKLSKKYPIIDIYSHYKTLLEKIREILFTTPLYMHVSHFPEERQDLSKKSPKKREEIDISKKESGDSKLLTFIKNYERTHNFNFEEVEVIGELKKLQGIITKMWITFKDNHFRFAMNELNTLSTFNINDRNYEVKINELLDKILPILAIYEIFNRPLFESVYPELIPQTKRLGTYFARFLSSKYNLFGTNLMKLFNRLAFHNWSYLIIKKEMNRREFFNYLLKLPIWKYIPLKLKTQMIEQNN
ncbi:MAG: hypothetical protein ACFFC3_08130 [Candidatus Odinarchaeota archaeon]